MRDTLFNTNTDLVEWTFDDKVSQVFDDMVLRSVPIYRSNLELITLIASKYAQNNTHFYDLGASTGASSLALAKNKDKSIKIIAVDNSQAMIKKCKNTLQDIENATIICAGIEDIDIQNASIVVLNLTLQFITPEHRQHLIDKIYYGLNDSGVLIVSEKVHFAKNDDNELLNDLHLEFKKANGYSDLEIANKRQMLENVLITEDADTHLERFAYAGFRTYTLALQNLNFQTFIAIK
jgi:tRNA (cmo5U34)-methyltransferase